MKNRVALALAAAALALLPSFALAEGTSCNLPTYVVPDGHVVTSTIPAGATFFFYYLNNSGAANSRSYVLQVRNATNIWNQGFTVSAFSDLGVCTVALTPAATDVTNTEPQQHSASGRRYAFNHPPGGTGVEFSVANTSGVPLTYEFSISDTTQFSPTWSTNGTYATYWSFFNTTGNSISVTLSLTTTGGASAGSTTLTVPANRTMATNTVALGTGANLSGTATLTVLGPVGSILVEADVANFSISPPYIQPVKFQLVRDGR
jgi:hypothetical protein